MVIKCNLIDRNTDFYTIIQQFGIGYNIEIILVLEGLSNISEGFIFKFSDIRM